MPTAVVALGGNALLRRGDKPSLEAQRRNAVRAAEGLRAIAKKYRVVLTHGNGPQVGHIMLRSAAGKGEAYPLTLDVADAESEGEIGYLLQQALQNELGWRVVSLVTQVVVSARDPAWRKPTKPIGPWRADGSRRLVASPKPREIVEAGAIRALVRSGYVPIAAGGGGVPVVRRRGALEGVEAVIDKDLAAACLAREVDASAFFLLTDVSHVHAAHGSPKERPLDRLRAADARRMLREGEFPEGSMGPKVEAALQFLGRRPRGFCAIGSLDEPLAGTRMLP